MKGVGETKTLFVVMKNFIYVAGLALVMTACGSGATTEKAEVVATDTIPNAATDVVPAAATDVLPVAVPGPENDGKVATDVVPAGK